MNGYELPIIAPQILVPPKGTEASLGEQCYYNALSLNTGPSRGGFIGRSCPGVESSLSYWCFERDVSGASPK